MLNSEVSVLLNLYLSKVHKALQNKLYGIYVYGSCAYDAFDSVHSDIDLVVIVEQPLETSELNMVKNLHQTIVKEHPLGRRMDGQYVLLSDLGKPHDEMDAHPWFRDGVLHISGHGDINNVTWWTLKHDGITIYGPNIQEWNISIGWNDVLNTMAYNMNSYWLHRSKRPQTLFQDIDFSDAILTICRIKHSVKDGEIIPKTIAGELALTTFPAKWEPLIQEAILIRQSSGRRNILSKFHRTYLATRFIRWAVSTA